MLGTFFQQETAMAVQQWGIELILWLQGFSPALDVPFELFTSLGDENFNMLLLPLLYWCIDRRLGARASVLFLASTYLSGFVKLATNQPRPFEVDARVRKMADVLGSSFPSLHTQNAVAFWGYLAAMVRRRWLWLLSAILIVLIPLSRLYLGVHFPTDLAGGYLFGAALLAIFLRLERPIEAWLGRQGLVRQIGLAILAPLVMLLLLPADDEITVVSTAMLMGTGIGFALERRWVRFVSGGAWRHQALRFILGVVVVLALRFGLKALFEGLEPEPVFRFARYVAIGFWVGAGAPWVFVKLRLASKE
jgi:membrane-associated phospholipid phosphatase